MSFMLFRIWIELIFITLDV